ncbi:serine hydrolase [Bdellovibrio sp. HCB117]|uniref:serine hydrolase n=1 Tax=Bdellovibrio sp. HCB117 TaxID=3394359 RepID=UPI0039B389F2
MDFKRILRAMTFALTATLVKAPAWASSKTFEESLKELEAKQPIQLGVFVKNLSTGEILSYRGDDLWYVASGVKLPIVLENLRQVDQKKYTLDSQIELRKEDFVDGAGYTNSKKAGSKLSVKFLMEQALIYSDNTASDLLIRQAGLESVNSCVQDLVPGGFTAITTLADVRRRLYSEVHPSSEKLQGPDFILLKRSQGDEVKFRRLSQMLGVDTKEFKCKTLDEAYDNYYSKKLNSATLKAYAELLEKVAEGKILGDSTQKFLIDTMTKVQTGQRRIKAGLPKKYSFAHKTGTQHSRICDFGIAWDKKSELKTGIVIAACVKDFESLDMAESALKSVGTVLHKAGIL